MNPKHFREPELLHTLEINANIGPHDEESGLQAGGPDAGINKVVCMNGIVQITVFWKTHG